MHDTIWRKLGILIAIIALFLVSLYFLYNTVLNKDKDFVVAKGDPPAEESSSITFGGTVDNPSNNTLSISGIQTAYIQYTTNQITFEQMIEKEEQYLKELLVVPTLAKEGYLQSAGYSANSATQVYYQSNKEKTRTIILRVEYGKKENTVSRMYDGSYYRIVDVTSDGKSLSVYKDGKLEEPVEVK
jgi:hypothetical protein